MIRTRCSRPRYWPILSAVAIVAAGLGAVRVFDGGPASATTVTLNPTADAGVDAALPTVNFGASASLQVLNGAPERLAFLKFDLTTVPAGSVINSATLRLYRTTASAAVTVQVRRVLAPWVESTVTYTGKPGVDLTVRGSVASPATTGGYDEIDVKTLVNDWVNLSSANANEGVELSATSAILREYASRDSGTNRPELVIDYTAPATSASIPSSTAPVTLDHVCNTAEYTGALSFSYPDLGGVPGTLKLQHDASNLYVCVSGPVGTDATRYFAVYTDNDNGRETLAQIEDQAREITIVPGTVRTSRVGTGAGGYTTPVTFSPDWAANAGTNAGPAAEAAEFSIPIASLPAPCAFGLAVYHNAVTAPADRFGWPSNVAFDKPFSWVTVSLAGVPACAPTTTTSTSTTTATTTPTTTPTTTTSTTTTVPGGGAGSAFTALPPDRLFDTRVGESAPGPKGLIPPGGTIEVVATGRSGVPASGVTAVAMNVTVTDALSAGFAVVFPTGQGRPLASAINIVPGPDQAVPNLVVIPLGTGGRVSFFLSGGGNVLADVAGYFSSVTGPAAAGRFVGMTPGRIFDSRPSEGAPGPKGFVGAGGTVTVQVTGVSGVPSTGVSAVVLNLTATVAAGPGFITAYPTGALRPVASALNLVRPGHTAANLVILPIGTSGRIDFFSSAGAHLLADVQGYFTDTTAPAATTGLFVPLTPGRLFDTRPGEPGGGGKGFVPADSSISRPATGVADVPAAPAVSAVLINITATEAAAPGFITGYPSGRIRPLASSLNLTTTGETRANAAMLEVGLSGEIVYFSQSGAHLLADTSGYFRN